MSYSISRAEPASTSIDVHAESAPCPNLSLTACHVDAVASADARLTESGAPDAPVRTPRAQPSDPRGGVALCTWRRVIAVAALVLSGCEPRAWSQAWTCGDGHTIAVVQLDSSTVALTCTPIRGGR
jgi:hypothetical protein